MEENAESSIRSLILRDLNLKEVQFEIIKDSGVSDGSAVCIVSQSAYNSVVDFDMEIRCTTRG